MRVVAGSARGRPLRAPSGDRVRPTADRVREATFNALGSLGLVEGARVLDLFAGTGALGIEALSRGAAGAWFVDDDPRSLATVRANLAATGLADRATVVRAEAVHWLTASGWAAGGGAGHAGGSAGAGRAGGAGGPTGGGATADSGAGHPTGAGAAAAAAAAAGAGAAFDLALVDPPYRFDRWPHLLALLPAPWVVAESDQPVAEPPGWRQVRCRRYGATVTTFLRRPADDHHGEG